MGLIEVLPENTNRDIKLLHETKHKYLVVQLSISLELIMVLIPNRSLTGPKVDLNK